MLVPNQNIYSETYTYTLSAVSVYVAFFAYVLMLLRARLGYLWINMYASGLLKMLKWLTFMRQAAYALVCVCVCLWCLCVWLWVLRTVCSPNIAHHYSLLFVECHTKINLLWNEKWRMNVNVASRMNMTDLRVQSIIIPSYTHEAICEQEINVHAFATDKQKSYTLLLCTSVKFSRQWNATLSLHDGFFGWYTTPIY